MDVKNIYNDLNQNENNVNTKLTTQIFIENIQKFNPSSKYVALVKKKKVQKPLLGTLDILISLIILSPCVVGVWRGVWQLMDIYSDYFSAWQCCLLGFSIHVVFVLIQDILNNIAKEKSSNICKKIFNMMLRRIYMYIFCVACNMHWRGGWMIIDHYFGLKMSPTGKILKKGSGLFMVAFVGCLMMIMGLRSLCNCIAPPFVFCLDKKHTAFIIPTRFRAKGMYTAFNIIKKYPRFDHNKLTIPTEMSTPSAEKLVSSASNHRETFQSAAPKPFGVTYRGQPPSEFTTTSTTERITTLSYPEMTHQYHPYRQKYYPRNIQEVIGYATRYTKPIEINPELTTKFTNSYKPSSTQQKSKNFTQNDNDPFYLYKPQDPSDINLLATGNVRFAPPPWGNIKSTTYTKTYPVTQQSFQGNTHRQEILNSPKPLSVTLNIYPNDENEIHTDHRYGVRHFINRLGNFHPRMVRFPDYRTKKMVIHVNLYPDELNTGESKLYKTILTTPPAA